MKEIDWSNLSFGYMRTDYNVRCYYRDGKWGELELCSEETLNIHMAATCLHYGQEAFEGLKAYRGKDGKIRIFRPEANAERLQSTCRGILMPELPTEKFCEAVKKVVKANERFIPPYESGASLYIRPLLIGTGAQVGVHPASEYMFVVFVTPVGPYFKGGFATNPYVIIRQYDRAAPLGTGTFKVGGNYAASLRANKMAHDAGYASEFYLDAKEKKYIPSQEKAKVIYTLAQESIPTLPSETSSVKMLVTEAVRVLKEVDTTLGLILSRMQEIAKTLPEYSVVREMGGVGNTLAPKLIAEIGDVRRFRNGKALVAFAGIDPPPYESGQFVGCNRKISKRGSASLRKVGYETMRSLKMRSRPEDPVYRYVVKKESEGKSKKSAKIAGLNKFLRIYYARVTELYKNI